LHPAEPLRNDDRREPQVSHFSQYAQGDTRLLTPDGIEIGFDFLFPELVDRAPHGKVLVAEVFDGEYFFRQDVFNEKGATLRKAGNGCRYCHGKPRGEVMLYYVSC